MEQDMSAGRGTLPVILGPTATGKSDLALELAMHFDAEIVSGDSMQVYRGMDIGTAKLPEAERRGIPHHMLDIIDPEQPFSVADFRELAAAAIRDIQGRGKLPLLTGGTGLYIDSLLYPYNFAPETAARPGLRRELQAEYQASGAEAMHQRLAGLDPEAAGRIHPNDAHRLIRALEVRISSGRSISDIQREKPPSPFRPLLIGLTLPREQLNARIDQRVERMIEAGLFDEVQALLSRGVSRDAVSMQGIGYRQSAAYLCSELSREEAIEQIKRDTRRFAKRQMTWFKRNEDINWFEIDHYREEGSLAEAAGAWLAGKLEEECT